VVAVAVALMCAALSAESAFAAEDVPVAPPSFPSPFGPGYDPTRPPPKEPETKGRGVVEAKLRGAGAAEIEERRADSTFAKLAGVVLDIRIAGDSVTEPLGHASVTAKTEDGSVPLHALCVPTAPDPLFVYRVGLARIRQWHVAVDGATYDCSERNARLATEVDDGGMRLVATGEWQGPLVLMFKADPQTLRKVTIPGAEVELPPSKQPAPAERAATQPAPAEGAVKKD
jgi:hypothetical protein